MISAISPSKQPSSRRGFTLVEILVVIGIIVVLVSILLPTLIHAYANADKTKTAADLQTISVALEAYRADFGDYPRIDRNRALNGQDTGAALLCKSLVGPGPATVDATAAYNAANAYTVGSLVLQGGIDYLAPMAIAAGTAPPAAPWVAWSPLDGADGMGFKTRVSGGIGIGKTWGPYLQIDRIKLNGGMLVDVNSNPYLYYPTAIIKPDISVAPNYCGAYVAGTTTPLYCSTDNLSEMPVTCFRAMLGDFSLNGAIDATYGTENAIGNYPFLLIAAGADGAFGPSQLAGSNTTSNESLATTWTTTVASAPTPSSGYQWDRNKRAMQSCDDITNFPRQ